MDNSIILYGFSAVFMVGGFFLNLKDKSQEREIKALEREITEKQKPIDLLFKKHDDDSRELQELKIKIAGTLYTKEELNERFNRLEESIASLTSNVNNLMSIIIADRQKNDK